MAPARLASCLHLHASPDHHQVILCRHDEAAVMQPYATYMDNDQIQVPSPKRVKLYPQIQMSAVRRDLLELRFTHVKTLREYLLCKLPVSSRLRRRKIAQLGLEAACGGTEYTLSQLLDTCLVGFRVLHQHEDTARWASWLSFSQKVEDSYVTVSGGPENALYSQKEIVEFVIWLLFSREKRPGCWPRHLICDGFRRGNIDKQDAPMNIPGIYSVFENANVAALCSDPWPQVLALLGQAGERIMIDLLIDCSIFLRVHSGYNNYYQLNGLPLAEYATAPNATNLSSESEQTKSKTPSEISIVRSRVFYGKPSFNAGGFIQAGLKPIHALNRLKVSLPSQSKGSPSRTAKDDLHTLKLMMYIFPRQFCLHNVFTSVVDSNQTSQKFQDYTLREDEISAVIHAVKQRDATKLPNIPKRLRGDARRLVRRMQLNHKRCSYHELLNHYCPLPIDINTDSPVTVNTPSTSQQPKADNPPNTYRCPSIKKRQESGSRTRASQMRETILKGDTTITDLACTGHHVSMFCQTVLSRLIPTDFWGVGETGLLNQTEFFKKIGHFLSLRRFENMSLHELVQGITISNIAWLQLPSTINDKPSKTETTKRMEIFLEFLYYTVDSLLIPLLRNNFYVTESNTDKYKVFYFRQDVWKMISDPAMDGLRNQMLEEFTPPDLKSITASRKLGTAKIRLLPKGSKLRPITNLKRREMAGNKSKTLLRSINSIMKPVHTMLQLEKTLNPSMLGASMFSVGELYWRIKSFRTQLKSPLPSLYFAKLDVQAAFDTIPQETVLNLMSTVPKRAKFRANKHTEISTGERPLTGEAPAPIKQVNRWHNVGQDMADRDTLVRRIEATMGHKKKNTVFVGSAAVAVYDTRAMLQLMDEHVAQNLVKVGNKLYRQKKGIPQGSVISSFLCNYFYADLERRHLPFLAEEGCLLVRLIDDFLLITTDESKAKKFVRVMHRGFPEYGVQVSKKKTLVNFDMTLEGERVCKVDGRGFPYCGTAIDCKTLDISKDRERSATIREIQDFLIPNTMLTNSRYCQLLDSRIWPTPRTELPAQSFECFQTSVAPNVL
ncbi:hypothetical protein VHEMI04004 [[Torrubiella] hemipterigena]|uniref:Telomerase reverse transcriptase n=1 Tax=[Torrubiella] hemipterigena TaxID=1531966 RepID=A0A0A1TF48_9HYPO|nr:hypothetical protein VHEMI04004 [[Torrubiella] hemipterigena]